MSRLFSRLFVLLAVLVVAGCSGAFAQQLLTIVSPGNGQIVRETVKVVIPASQVPANGYISMGLQQNESQIFIGAFDPAVARKTGANLAFLWNSKQGFTETDDPKNEKFVKDGVYTLNVTAYDSEGAVFAKGSTKINLQNAVARTNPAPAVRLLNRLAFGQMDTFTIKAEAQLYNKYGLPAAGGLGITTRFRVIQNVEDVRPDSTILMRYRIDAGGSFNYFGSKTGLYAGEDIRPQLYRIIDRRGNVRQRNVFKKQAKYSIVDILPVLPAMAVREGDTWRDSMQLKLDGMTGVMEFTGTARLDAFEWQGGRKCAKIVSDMDSNSPVIFGNGEIRSGAGIYNARVVTYFDYARGLSLRREILIDMPVEMDESIINDGAAPSQPTSSPSAGSTPYSDDDDDMGGGLPGRPINPSGRPGQITKPLGVQGSIQINAVVQLGKY